jgi:hypothetical protein
MMHQFLVIDGTAFHTSLLAKRLCPCLILAIEDVDHIRSRMKRRIWLFGMRQSACEVDQSGRKFRHRLQWIGEAGQGFKRGKRRKRRQWVATAGKTSKMGRKRRKPSDIIIVNTQFLQSLGKRRKSCQVVPHTYQLCQRRRKRGKRTDMIV